MRRLIIALFGVLAVFAMAAPAAAASHTAARVLHHASARPKVAEVCGFLRDQDGAGLEASAYPGEPTQQIKGTLVTDQGSGGWQVCYEAADHALYLATDSGECFAKQPSGRLAFYPCNDDGDQTFYEDSDPNGLVFTNANSGTDSLCGFADTGSFVTMSGTCSTDGGSYHWEFSSLPHS